MMKMFRIVLEGKTYEVGIEEMEPVGASAPAAILPPTSVPVPSPAAAPLSAAAAPTAITPPASAGTVPSPMAGTVLKILIAPGEAVKANQQIMVLEAMKMETPIYAPSAGTVQSVLVKTGYAVAEGQGLLIIG